MNESEAMIIGNILSHLNASKGAVGVITFYKEQVNLLRNLGLTSYAEIDTVDAFQGREKDVIILSCVRSNTDRSLGFLADVRRLNVALTRARDALWIFGNLKTLRTSENPVWSELVQFCERHGTLVSAESLTEVDIISRIQAARKRPLQDAY